jgi:hypothetical protein
MYFENFPKFLYDFPVNPLTGKLIAVTDITQNVRFKAEFIKNISVYETIEMADGETIEMVSEKIYGSPDYHWILMLLNERYDHLNDFPLSSKSFDKFVKRKYGSRVDDAKHFIDENGHITNAPATITIQNSITDIKTGSILRRKTSIGNYTARVNEVDTSGKSLQVTLTNSLIRTGDTIEVYNYSLIDGKNQEKKIGTAQVTSVVVPSKYTMVTNYEYEVMLNESKRTIKVVPQAYLAQILSEFEALV